MDIEYENIIFEIKEKVQSNEAKEILDSFLNTTLDETTPFETLSAIFKFGFSKVFPLEYIFKMLIISIAVLFVLNLFNEVLKKRTLLEPLRYFFMLSITFASIIPSYKLVCNAIAYMRDISTFLGVAFPTLGILTASGGNIATAKMQSVSFSLLLGCNQILINTIVPFITTFLFGIAIIDSFLGEGKMVSLSGFIKNSFFGAFSIYVSLFYIIINAYGQAAAGADTVSARSLKLLVTNAIPIVGGTLGESLKFVAGGIVNIKNMIGVSAVVFILSLFMPILILLWGGGILLNLVNFFCDYLSVAELKTITTHIKYSFNFMLAAFSAITVSAILNINAFLSFLPTII